MSGYEFGSFDYGAALAASGQDFRQFKQTQTPPRRPTTRPGFAAAYSELITNFAYGWNEQNAHKPEAAKRAGKVRALAAHVAAVGDDDPLVATISFARGGTVDRGLQGHARGYLLDVLGEPHDGLPLLQAANVHSAVPDSPVWRHLQALDQDRQDSTAMPSTQVMLVGLVGAEMRDVIELANERADRAQLEKQSMQPEPALEAARQAVAEAQAQQQRLSEQAQRALKECKALREDRIKLLALIRRMGHPALFDLDEITNFLEAQTEHLKSQIAAANGDGGLEQRLADESERERKAAWERDVQAARDATLQDATLRAQENVQASKRGYAAMRGEDPSDWIRLQKGEPLVRPQTFTSGPIPEPPDEPQNVPPAGRDQGQSVEAPETAQEPPQDPRIDAIHAAQEVLDKGGTRQHAAEAADTSDRTIRRWLQSGDLHSPAPRTATTRPSSSRTERKRARDERRLDREARRADREAEDERS
jgi:hypothetical protein